MKKAEAGLAGKLAIPFREAVFPKELLIDDA